MCGKKSAGERRVKVMNTIVRAERKKERKAAE